MKLFSRIIAVLSLQILTSHYSAMVLGQEFKKFEYIADNDTLRYNILIPDSLAIDIAPDSNSRLFPMVIFLHGSGERGYDNGIQTIHIREIFLNNENRKKYPAFVVAPQCPPNKRWVETSWTVSKHIMPVNPSETMVLTIKLIDKLIENYPVDPKRIYVSGLSMGGFGTWDMICRYPGKFAAAIPICGGGDISKAPLLKKTPVWAFHGSNDKVVKPILSRDMINALKKIGGKPIYTEYPGVGHDSWVKAFKEKELLEWLFNQTL